MSRVLETPRPAAALRTAAPLIVLGLLAAMVVALSPEERTLGDGIRSVYVHVPLTLTGRLGLTLAGIAGAALLLTGRRGLRAWGQSLGWVGWWLLGSGYLVSLYSSYDNWGGIFWAEPRTVAVAQSLALALGVLVLNTTRLPIRVQGGLLALMAAGMTFFLARADLVLHPRNPITTSQAADIQATFGLLLALCLAGAAWSVWRRVRALNAG